MGGLADSAVAVGAPRRILAVVFHNFEMLDVFGPLQLFKAANGALAKSRHLRIPLGEAPPPLAYEIQTVSLGLTQAKSSGGPLVGVDENMADSSVPLPGGEEQLKRTTLLIPGGIGSRPLVENRTFTQWLYRRGGEAQRVATVCTGSLLAARSGLLDGHRATTNKLAFDWVRDAARAPDVEWIRQARWVATADGTRWTSSGVSAGIDMAHAMIKADYGQEVADQAARFAEYTPNRDPSNDPFGGPGDTSE